jgi:hypothetical protein
MKHIFQDIFLKFKFRREVARLGRTNPSASGAAESGGAPPPFEASRSPQRGSWRQVWGGRVKSLKRVCFPFVKLGRQRSQPSRGPAAPLRLVKKNFEYFFSTPCPPPPAFFHFYLFYIFFLILGFILMRRRMRKGRPHRAATRVGASWWRRGTAVRRRRRLSEQTRREAAWAQRDGATRTEAQGGG